MSVHEKAVGASVEWYTPPSLLDALGLTFDLDPASPNPPVPWVPAKRFYWEGGETLPWFGRVWLNPPYGPAAVSFVHRMIEHNHGLMLLPARTETRAFQSAAWEADEVVFLRDRLHFVRRNGVASRSSFASALLVYGLDEDPELRFAVAAADLGWHVSNQDPWRIGTGLSA